jgi:hypothetical protein
LRGGVEQPAAEAAGQDERADDESAPHPPYFAVAFDAAAADERMLRR